MRGGGGEAEVGEVAPDLPLVQGQRVQPVPGPPDSPHRAPALQVFKQKVTNDTESLP